MTDYADYTQTANVAAAEGLRHAKDITVASIEVFKSLTAVMVPLTVALLPKSERLLPAIDTMVSRSFDTAVKVVEAQHQFGIVALDQLAAAAQR